MSSTDLAGERWLPIADWEDIYEVSTLGRVRSLERRVPVDRAGYRPFTKLYRQRLMKLHDTSGYLRVGLHRDDVEEPRSVGALVLEAFVGPRPPGHRVMTLDGDYRNIRLANLRYATFEEIVEGMRARGTLAVGEDHYAARLTPEDVQAIRASAPQESVKAIAAAYKIAATHVRYIIAGKRWKQA